MTREHYPHTEPFFPVHMEDVGNHTACGIDLCKASITTYLVNKVTCWECLGAIDRTRFSKEKIK
jgi:hypothetical protein